MKLKLLKPFSMFAVGDVVDLGRGQAELLIQRKVAEPFEEKPVRKVERATNKPKS
jgi:hypothetical protein